MNIEFIYDRNDDETIFYIIQNNKYKIKFSKSFNLTYDKLYNFYETKSNIQINNILFEYKENCITILLNLKNVFLNYNFNINESQCIMLNFLDFLQNEEKYRHKYKII